LVELSSLIESRSESLSVIHESRVSPSQRPCHLILSELTVPREDMPWASSQPSFALEDDEENRGENDDEQR
jgi:hypothetical protein